MRNACAQFTAVFPDEATCLDRLMISRYGGLDFTCPACKRLASFKPDPKARTYACGSCGHTISPCAGTPFENSRQPLVDWFLAAYLLERSAGTVTTKDLQAEIGCSYKACWRMEHDLRAVLAARDGGGSSPEWLALIETALGLDGRARQPRRDEAPRPAPPPEDGRTVIAFARPSARASPAPIPLDRTPEPTPVLPRAETSAGKPRAPAAAKRSRTGPVSRRESPEPLPAAAEVPPAAEAGAATVAPRRSRRLAGHLVVLGAVAGCTALAAVVASLLTDRSGRIDGLESESLMPPPSLTIAALRPSLRLSPRILDDADEDEPAPADVPDRETYDTIIKEGTAPGPRDPNEIIEFGPMRIRRHLVETIVKAARETGADPVLLMAIADKESSFSTAVQAKTSSATGLFQFIGKTWLKVVHDFGAQHGLEKEAKEIVWDDDELTVSNTAEKNRILDLRRDPYISAVLAAEMLKRDRMRIARRIGRDLTHGETYLAHFLGPDGAERFMENMVKKPDSVAADLLPKPAKANRPIFFASLGGKTKGLSLAEVHDKFEAMMGMRTRRYQNVGRLVAPLALADGEPALVLRVDRGR